MLARPLAYLRQGFSCAEAEFSGFWGDLSLGAVRRLLVVRWLLVRRLLVRWHAARWS